MKVERRAQVMMRKFGILVLYSSQFKDVGFVGDGMTYDAVELTSSRACIFYGVLWGPSFGLVSLPAGEN